METQENKPRNIYQKLLAIQQKINGLGKDKAAFGYKYVTGDKVLENIKPLMNEIGLILKHEILSIDNCRQDYNTKNGSKSEILSKVMMRFTWVDTETGEKDENLFGANGQNDWDKGVGSALTYGERYFLLKFFHIATDEDDIDNPDRKPEDNKTEAKSQESTSQPKPSTSQSTPALEWLNIGTEKWKEALKFLKNGGTMEQIKKKYKLSKENEQKLKEESLKQAA